MWVQTGQAAARQMVEQNKLAPGRGGAIINMSSVNAVMAIPTIAGYNASKGGVNNLTRYSLATVGLVIGALTKSWHRRDGLSYNILCLQQEWFLFKRLWSYCHIPESQLQYKLVI